MILGLPK